MFGAGGAFGFGNRKNNQGYSDIDPYRQGAVGYRPNDVNPYLPGGVGRAVAGVPMYDTDQTNQARNTNIDISQQRGNAQGALELNRTFDDLLRRQNAQIDYDKRQGYTYNATANANSARAIAEDTARQMNNMYANSAQRLMNAANNTQSSLAGSTQALAAMFAR